MAQEVIFHVVKTKRFMSQVSTKNETNHEISNIRKHEGMHDSHFYEKLRNAMQQYLKQMRISKGKGYIITIQRRRNA